MTHRGEAGRRRLGKKISHETPSLCRAEPWKPRGHRAGICGIGHPPAPSKVYSGPGADPTLIDHATQAHECHSEYSQCHLKSSIHGQRPQQTAQGNPRGALSGLETPAPEVHGGSQGETPESPMRVAAPQGTWLETQRVPSSPSRGALSILKERRAPLGSQVQVMPSVHSSCVEQCDLI